jgi:tRNA threonylcarbamoyladenosine biosynthesis protein TsaB
LLGISTLDATAFPHLGRPEPVCALVPAGRGRLCWSTYWPENRPSGRPAHGEAITIGRWKGMRTPTVLSDVQELAQETREPTWLVGELTDELGGELHHRLGENARVMPISVAARRAGALAELAWLRLQAGEADDLASLSPIYLREP